jgi:hypothetical protein
MIDPNQPLDPHAAEVREVYAWFGLSMYWAQCVERELAMVLTVALWRCLLLFTVELPPLRRRP